MDKYNTMQYNIQHAYNRYLLPKYEHGFMKSVQLNSKNLTTSLLAFFIFYYTLQPHPSFFKHYTTSHVYKNSYSTIPLTVQRTNCLINLPLDERTLDQQSS